MRATNSSGAGADKPLGRLSNFQAIFDFVMPALVFVVLSLAAPAADRLQTTPQFRGPVDIALAADESWAASANELSGTVSLIDLRSQKVADELKCGGRPTSIIRVGVNQLVISCRESGEVIVAEVNDQDMSIRSRIQIGFQPHGLAAHGGSDKATAKSVFVSLVATGEIAEIDLGSERVIRKFATGAWPRHLAISPDGMRLAVGLSGESAIAVLDVASGEELYREPLSGGINLGHMQCSANGDYVYFPWMIYRSNPINARNIRRGWILASRAARVRLDGPADREALVARRTWARRLRSVWNRPHSRRESFGHFVIWNP